MIFGKNDPAPAKTGTAKESKPASPDVPVAASSAPPSKPGERQSATIRLVDRPDVTETFADSITSLLFDGQTLRIEFAVTRLDEVKLKAPLTGRRYPACRVVLTPGAAADLINRIQQIATALTQAGVVKPAQPSR
jgi:hypothetical protein